METTRIWIKETGVTGQFPNLERYSAPYHCMHCEDPSCVSACTVGALQKGENGIVTYDNDRCIGCRYCMYACPFGVPNFEWEQMLPLIVKCDLCVSRLGEGESEPACAATCPTDAILFGTKKEMLDLAHEKIEANPDKYVDHVYGEHENGGTATFYISPIPFDELGFPGPGETSSAYSNRLVTHGTPAVAGAVATGLSGIYLTIKHHEEAVAETAAAAPNGQHIPAETPSSPQQIPQDGHEIQPEITNLEANDVEESH